MAKLAAPQKRRLEQIASSILVRRGQSVLAIAVLAGGSGYLYLQHLQQQAAARRRKLRAKLRCARRAALVQAT